VIFIQWFERLLLQGGTDSGSWTKIQTIQLELNNTDAQEVHLRAAVEVQLLRWASCHDCAIFIFTF